MLPFVSFDFSHSVLEQIGTGHIDDPNKTLVTIEGRKRQIQVLNGSTSYLFFNALPSSDAIIHPVANRVRILINTLIGSRNAVLSYQHINDSKRESHPQMRTPSMQSIPPCSNAMKQWNGREEMKYALNEDQ